METYDYFEKFDGMKEIEEDYGARQNIKKDNILEFLIHQI